MKANNFNNGEFNPVKAISDVLKSDNPAKWVAGIALSVAAVGWYAIKVISAMNGR